MTQETQIGIQLTPEEIAQTCADVRIQMNRQLDTLCGDDIEMHFAVRDVLAGLIAVKRGGTRENNG